MQHLFTACPAPQSAPASTEPAPQLPARHTLARTRLPARHTLARTQLPARPTRARTQLPARHTLASTQPVCPCHPSNFTVSKVAPAFPQVNFQHFPQNSKIFWFPTNPTPATPHVSHTSRQPHLTPATAHARCSSHPAQVKARLANKGLTQQVVHDSHSRTNSHRGASS